MRGRHVEIAWQGRRLPAWQPDRLALIELTPGHDTETAARSALAAAVRADASLPTGWESLARILLRTEGIASSGVEGITAPAADIFAADLDVDADGDAGWVADNLSVVEQAVDAAPEPLTVEALHAWHRRLLRHGHLPDAMVGAFRTAPGWIGGTSPLNASFVPPPADDISELIDDLVAYANGRVDDPITQAAVVHAQFETIHPYGDGNGRLGRVLVAWVLRRRLGLDRVTPPISVLIARDPGGYLSGLWQFREGSLDAWITWFAQLVERAAAATSDMVADVERVTEQWARDTAHLRVDSSARAALGVLVEHPVLTAGVLADRTGVSTRAARNALATLHDLGIVAPHRPPRQRHPARPHHWWAATALLDIVARWGQTG